MKYLKKYESFSSFLLEVNDCVKNCKDIMIELEDYGVHNKVDMSIGKEIDDDSKFKTVLYVDCSILNYKRMELKELINDTRWRLSDYMKSEGFEEVSMKWFSSGYQFKITFKKEYINQ